MKHDEYRHKTTANLNYTYMHFSLHTHKLIRKKGKCSYYNNDTAEHEAEHNTHHKLERTLTLSSGSKPNASRQFRVFLLSLTLEQCLGNNGCKAAKQMPSGINKDRLKA